MDIIKSIFDNLFLTIYFWQSIFDNLFYGGLNFELDNNQGWVLIYLSFLLP